MHRCIKGLYQSNIAFTSSRPRSHKRWLLSQINLTVLVATICVVAGVGYSRIKPGQGIGLAYRGSLASEDGQGTGNAPRSPSETGKRGESQGHTPARNSEWHLKD